jgi:hypothetical protein
MSNKLRPFGEVTDDLEIILEEMVDEQEMQTGEILAQIFSWIQIHRPEAMEEYLDGTNPVFYYGPKKEE